jgi:three-Cys-motif partner protein
MNSTKSRTNQLDDELLPLFPELPLAAGRRSRKYKRIDQLIWSDHKARFIQHYLRYFVQITKHGAYIDGFAGPQYLDKLDAWTASLVLASEPKWLRNFYLCELAPDSVKCLRDLVAAQPVPMSTSGRKLPRKIEVVPGDFNQTIESILLSGTITQ